MKATAIIVTAFAIFSVSAHADGLPPPQAYPLPPPSVIQGQSCVMTAIQLGYQTGRREVAYAATEACIAAGERGVVLPYGYYGPYVPPRPPLFETLCFVRLNRPTG